MIAKSVQRLKVKVIANQGEIAMPMISPDTYRLFDPGLGIAANPERPADVGERDGYHLVVKFGRHSSDEDAAEAKQGLDIHGIC